MPFITQCPYDDCGKYMLLEDEVQGTTVACLCCRRAIELIIELLPGDTPSADSSAPADPDAQSRFVVRKCPKCQQAIRIPPEKQRQAVACLNCDFWGILW